MSNLYKRLARSVVAGMGLLACLVPVVADERDDQVVSQSKRLQPARTPVELGERLFRHNFSLPESWQESQPLGAGGDGLGPQFNDVSCIACHHQGGTGGGGPVDKNALVVSLMIPSGLSAIQQGNALRQAGKVFPELTPQQSSAPLHRFGIPGSNDDRLYDELLADIYDFVSFNPVKPSPAYGTRQQITLEVAQRNTSALWGLGVIEELRLREGNGIRRRLMQEQNQKYPGLSGRIPRDGQQQESWYGWRGQVASLHEFNLQACATEMGLTVPGVEQDRSPVGSARNSATRLDLTNDQTLSLTAFVASLPAPQQVLPTDPAALERIRHGEQLFHQVHCGACHVPDLGWVKGIYSDMLLHDMGPQLCDQHRAVLELMPGEVVPGMPVGYYTSPPLPESLKSKFIDSNAHCEWRTPPLWGVADSAPYLHDGRAETLEEAIRWHGGEAEFSRLAYERLTPGETAMLLEFLGTLRAPQPGTTPSSGLLAASQVTSKRSATGTTPAGTDAQAAGGSRSLRTPPPRADVAMESSGESAERDGPVTLSLDSSTVVWPELQLIEVTPEGLESLSSLLALPAKSSNANEAVTLTRRVEASQPGDGAADYALALFQRQALLHREFRTGMVALSVRSGPYAARARQHLIREELRNRNHVAAAAALESHLAKCLVDTKLTPRDRAEQVEWVGIVAGWMQGPAGIEESKFDTTAVHQRLVATLDDSMGPYFNSGLTRVENRQARLLEERSVLVDSVEAERTASQTTLAQQQETLQQQQAGLQQSREELQRRFETELEKLDRQLGELELQASDLEGVVQRLTSEVNLMTARANSLDVSIARTGGGRGSRGPGQTAASAELMSVRGQQAVSQRQLDEKLAQGRTVLLKAQNLLATRQNLIRDYQQRTGATVKQLASVQTWNKRIEKRATEVGETTADRSKEVQQLDRKRKDLATYDQFDWRQEPAGMLARYRAVEAGE